MNPSSFVDPYRSMAKPVVVDPAPEKDPDAKTSSLGAQFFAALAAEEVRHSPLQRSPTLRVTLQEWSDIMSGAVRAVRREYEFSVSPEELADIKDGKKDLADVTGEQ